MLQTNVLKFFSKGLLVFFLSLTFLISGTNLAEAGFGITPPYVRNSSLTRNMVYEQPILMVRGDPTVALRAEISIDAPEIQDWIEIVEGNDISLPKGEQKIPMTVRITVPKNADFKEYRGAIRIRTLPDSGEVTAGAVSISLGAQIDINLNVIDKKIKDFKVRKISLPELNEGRKFGWLYFPGKINFGIYLENTGNVEIAPSKVEFRIFDSTGNVLLEETENKGKIKTVAPYAAEEVMAEIPSRLPAGNYMVRYKIFNETDIKQEGEVSMSIRPFGTLQTAGFGFLGLSWPHKISILLPVLTLIILVLYSIFSQRKKKDLK